VTCDILFDIKLTSVISQGSNIFQISINFKKIILKLCVLSAALAWNGNQVVILKGSNSNKKNVRNV
jgi:hypothetical protein